MGRERLYEIIFEADTRAGKVFDVVLLVAIVASVIAVLLDSVEQIRREHGAALRAVEWLFTGLFTVEYVLRLSCVRRPGRYAVSFFGIVDLLAVLPTYVSIVVPGAQQLLVIRVLRMLRVFRVFKLARYLGEANVLLTALRGSVPKIVVFLGTVLAVVVIIGAAMHLIEGPEHGFTNIPASMYWAIVTMTTVGYGDLAPETVPGRVLAAALMILGYAIIAVPTGIVSAELVQRGARRKVTTQVCPDCLAADHDADAVHCKRCGARL